jgi:hypothetical protein
VVALGTNGPRTFLLAGRTLHDVTAPGRLLSRQPAAVAEVLRWQSGAVWEPLF